MALVHMRDMLRHALDNGYAIGAFRVHNLEFLEGILEAAENGRAPVILSLSAAPADHIDLEVMTAAAETAARRASIPIALHLEGCASLEDGIQGINLGCNSIGVAPPGDGEVSDIPLTQRLVGMAHGCGVPVTASIPMQAGLETAWQYIKQTGIDSLFLSANDMESMLGALQILGNPMEIPLAIRGDKELDSSLLPRFIANGVSRVDFGPVLMEAAATRLRCSADQQTSQPPPHLSGMRDTITRTVEHCLQNCGSEGRATDVLAHCAAWTPVEHLIIYNVSGISEHAAETMMAEGRRVLGGIPGVRKIVTGAAVKENAAYRYCWLITFVHPAVIDSYREHPAHVAFADELFRPVAAERISIDYQTSEDWTPPQANIMRRRSMR